MNAARRDAAQMLHKEERNGCWLNESNDGVINA
jgi:hypothetical protein